MGLKDLVDRVRRRMRPDASEDHLRLPLPLQPATKKRGTDYEAVDWVELARVEEAHRLNPGDDEVHYLLAYLLYASRHYSTAVRHFRELLARGFKVAVVSYHLGCCFHQLARPREAHEMWKRCLEAGPEAEIERKVRQRLEWFQANRFTPVPD